MTQQPPKPIPSLAEAFAVGTPEQERLKLEAALGERDAQRAALNSPDVQARSPWAQAARMRALAVTDPERWRRVQAARVNGASPEELDRLFKEV